MILKPEPALSLPGPLGRKQEWQSTCPRRIELTQRPLEQRCRHSGPQAAPGFSAPRGNSNSLTEVGF